MGKVLRRKKKKKPVWYNWLNTNVLVSVNQFSPHTCDFFTTYGPVWDYDQYDNLKQKYNSFTVLWLQLYNVSFYILTHFRAVIIFSRNIFSTEHSLFSL